MSGSLLAIILIPAVVLIVLAVWIYGVFYAERRPEPGSRSQPPDHEVSGGIFRAHGGRQLMPRPDATPPEAAGTGPRQPGSAAHTTTPTEEP